jgi:hypothetical protein
VRGWYLPEVAAGHAELDGFDVVQALQLDGGREFDVLTGISLHGGLGTAWPMAQVRARGIVERLIEHWRRFGLPSFAQFDNDRRFLGPAYFRPDIVSRVSRLCLSLDVGVVFAVPREHGPQSQVERFNGLWRAKVWERFHFRDLEHVAAQTGLFLDAHRRHNGRRIAEAPPRRPFPAQWRLDLQAQPRGRLVFLRRTDEHGSVRLQGRRFVVSPDSPYRMVRCDVLLDLELIRFFRLRRAAPTDQPLLVEIPYVLPKRAHFNE